MSENNNAATYAAGAQALISKWGNAVFDDGVSNAPQCFMRYGRRFLKPAHFSLICNIISYQYGSNAPYPSVETIAENLDMSVRRVQKMLEELQEEGNIEIYERFNDLGRQMSNEYSFEPLLEKCLAASMEMKIKRGEIKPEIKVKKVKRAKKARNDGDEQSVHPMDEQSIHPEDEQSIHPEDEQSVHPNKELEERAFNQEIGIKNLSIIEQINQLDIPTRLVEFLKDQKQMDRLIRHKIDVKEIELLFHKFKDQMGHTDFTDKLDDVLNAEKYTKGFKHYFRSSLEKMLKDMADYDVKKRKPVRVEKMPDRFKQDYSKYDFTKRKEKDQEPKKFSPLEAAIKKVEVLGWKRVNDKERAILEENGMFEPKEAAAAGENSKEFAVNF